MTVQRQSLTIPLGGGVDQGEGEKVLEQPFLRQLRNGRWSKRSEYVKREGSEQLGTPLNVFGSPVPVTDRPNTVFCHNQTALCQISDDGLLTWDEAAGKWTRAVDAPLPRLLESDVILASNEDHHVVNIAYDEATDKVCVVTADQYISVIQRESRVRLFGPSPLPSDFESMVSVLGFDGTFLIYGVNSDQDVITCTFNPVNHTFGTVQTVEGLSGDVLSLDAHVAAGQDKAVIALTRGSQWGVVQVNSDGTAGLSKYGSVLNIQGVAVHHSPAQNKVWVLAWDENVFPRLQLYSFSDSFSGVVSSSEVKAAASGLDPSRDLAVAVDSTGRVHCFASTIADGTYLRVMSSAGLALGSLMSLPDFYLVSRAAQDANGQVIAGLARKFSDPRDEANTNPCGYIIQIETSDYRVAGKFGLGRIFLKGFDGVATYDDSLPLTRTLIPVQDALWLPYAYDTTFDLRGAAVARILASEEPLRVVDAEGVSLTSGAMPASYDGGVAMEAACNTIPYIEQGTNTTQQIDEEGARIGPIFPNQQYTWDDLQPDDSQDTLEIRYEYDAAIVLVRVDSHGNLHRSSPGRTTVSGAMQALEIDEEQVYLIINEIDRAALDPSVDKSEWVAELYVGNFRWSIYRNPAGVDTEPELIETVVGDTSLRYHSTHSLASSIEPDYVFEYEDSGSIRPVPPLNDLRVLYTESGELPAEPLPPLLDICSTQQRLFGLDAEDRLRVWYSKPFTKALAPEWNAALTIRCAAEGGDLVALEVMSDQLILFKQSRIYITPVLSGPNALGSGPSFPPPREVHSDTGCVNRHSVVQGPWGVVFQAERGIYLLDRSASLTWVGEPVRDALEGNQIVSAMAVANRTEVRFLLDNATVLVWDYRMNQWSVWDSSPGIDTAVWRERWARLQSNGTVHVDTPDEYEMPGSGRPLLSATTAWIKLAGIQGFQRVRQALITGEYSSGDVQVDVGYDYEEDFSESHIFYEEDLLTWPRFQMRIDPIRQKSQAIRFRISEAVLTPYYLDEDITLESALAKTNDDLNLLPAPDAVIWTPVSGATITTGVNDPAGGTNAATVIDGGGFQRARTGTFAYTDGHEVWLSCFVKVDPTATVASELRILYSDGTFVRAQINAATGATSAGTNDGGAGQAQDLSAVQLDGWWFFTAKHAGRAGATTVALEVYPAITPSSATGSVTVYGPRIADATSHGFAANPTVNLVERPTIGAAFNLQALQLDVGVKKGNYKMRGAPIRQDVPDWLELTGVNQITLSDTSLTPLETPK